MPEKRLPMRQIREILRLHFEAQLKDRQIAKICSVGKGTVRRYLQRLAAAGLSWPLPADIDDEHRMFPPPPAEAGSRPLPDFTVLHKELKSLVWRHPEIPDASPSPATTRSPASAATGRADAHTRWRLDGPLL